LIWRKDRPINHFKDEHGKRIFNSKYGGKTAGTIESNGYARIKLNNIKFFSHVLIWKFHHGVNPKYQIDHIDRCPSNSRIENLRDVTRSDNINNTKVRSDNTSGVKGVNYSKNHNKWTARLNIRGNSIHLGLFTTKEDAILARQEAEAQDWSHILDAYTEKATVEITLDYLNERFRYDDGSLYYREISNHNFKTQKACDTWNSRYGNTKIQTKTVNI